MVVYEKPDGIRIGKKVIDSALLRSTDFPALLVKAYAKGLSSTFSMSRHEATEMITSAERNFRKTILIYGQVLVQKSEGDAINYAASLLAQIGYELWNHSGSGFGCECNLSSGCVDLLRQCNSGTVDLLIR
jgi:hypothetical protein